MKHKNEMEGEKKSIAVNSGTHLKLRLKAIKAGKTMAEVVEELVEKAEKSSDEKESG